MIRSEERMSRVDTAWLRMDTDVNRMMINGVWLLAPKLPHALLCARVSATLLRYARFRQKVVPDALGASWVDDDTFDLAAHVHSETLARGAGESAEDALKRRVAELAAQPLAAQRPLWQLHLIEDLDAHRSALVCRIHHCIADGIALISVMLTLADGGAAQPVPEPGAREAADDGLPGDGFADGLLKPFTSVATRLIGLSGQGFAKGLRALADPGEPLEDTIALARSAAKMGSDLAALALMADDAPTRLKGKAGIDKRVAWGPTLPLADVKVIGKALGCSINDVLLGCAAGAIGRYLRAKGDAPDGQEIRTMVPVNLRPPSDAGRLGNHFGLVPLVLPIGIENPVARIYAVHARMRELKGSTQPLLAFGVLALAGMLAQPLQAALVGTFARKATAVMTNVPGPSVPLTFCGRTIERVMFWVPQSGDIGVGASILSYAGGVQFGLITDAGLCPDPQQIVDAFAAEFEQLSWLAMMLPWGEPGD